MLESRVLPGPPNAKMAVRVVDPALPDKEKLLDILARVLKDAAGNVPPVVTAVRGRPPRKTMALDESELVVFWVIHYTEIVAYDSWGLSADEHQEVFARLAMSVGGTNLPSLCDKDTERREKAWEDVMESLAAAFPAAKGVPARSFERELHLLRLCAAAWERINGAEE